MSDIKCIYPKSRTQFLHTSLRMVSENDIHRMRVCVYAHCLQISKASRLKILFSIPSQFNWNESIQIEFHFFLHLSLPFICLPVSYQKT
jgi:hypothetical protein